MVECTISSVSMRYSRSKILKKHSGMKFVCDFCKKKRELGWATEGYLRVERGGEEWVLCGGCLDVLTDMVRYGLQVIGAPKDWKVSSYVLRVTAKDEMFNCMRCGLQRTQSIGITLDNLKMAPVEKGRYEVTCRICTECFIESMSILVSSEILQKHKYALFEWQCEGDVYVRW